METVEDGTPGAIKRTTKTGKEVWERRDGYVDGVITSMFNKEREYNGEVTRSLVIRLRDKDEHYSLEVTQGSRYWVGILMRLPNINFQKPVRFAPYDFDGSDDKGGTRKVIGINLYQNGEKIDPAWTKTNPGDLPQGKQVRVNSKDVWDFEARDAYLLKVFAELNDQLKTGDMVMGGANDEPAHIQGDDESSLPF